MRRFWRTAFACLVLGTAIPGDSLASTHVDRVRPDRVHPDRVHPDRVAPDRVAPDRVHPDRVAPDRVHPAWREFEPRFTATVCPFAGLGDYDRDEVECGYVLVPEDRTSADSRLIQLAVMRFAATDPEAPAGATLRLDGGPGGPSLTAGRAAFYGNRENRSLRDLGDVVFHDQRGIGYSGAAFCRALPDAYQYGERMGEGGFRRLRQNLATCLDEARRRGIAVDAYSTWHNALDVRDLRRALGYESWNLFGVSYGTQLAQAVLEVDPQGVRAAVLDSVAPAAPGPTGGWGAVAYGMRTSLDALDAACQEHSRCRQGFPSFSQALLDAIRAYDRDPLLLDGLDRSRFPRGRAVLDAEMVGLFTFQVLYDEALYSDLPIYLHVLETRHQGALRAYLNQAAWPVDHQVGQGMRLVANCRGAATLSPAQQAAHRQREPELARWLRYHDTTDTCLAAYEIKPDGAVRRLESEVPVLVGAGAFDPVTPPWRAREVLPGLPRAIYVEFPYAGHGVLLDGGCGREVAYAFLRQPEMRPATHCLQDTEAPEFLVDFHASDGVFRLLESAQTAAWPWLLLGLPLGLASSLMVLARKIFAREHRASRLALLAGTVASIATLTSAVVMLLGWMADHPLALPVALPRQIVLVAWPAALGVALAGLGLTLRWRTVGGGEGRIRSLVGSTFVFVLALANLALLQVTVGVW